MITNFQKENLCLLKEIIQQVVAEGKVIDMKTWCLRTKCGTVACLGGWAMMDPRLRARGFRSTKVFGIDSQPIFSPEDGIFCYGDQAIKHFFGFTDSETYRIFFAATLYDEETGDVKDFLLKDRLEFLYRIIDAYLEA
jgi:hypothetical protein